MRRTIILLCVLVGLITLAGRAYADPAGWVPSPDPPIQKIYIPDVEGELVIYEMGYTQCSIFFIGVGMAKTAPVSCVLLPTYITAQSGPVPFRILQRVKVEEE